MAEEYPHLKDSGIQPSPKWDGGCLWVGLGVILGGLTLGLFFVISSLTRIYRVETNAKPEITIIAVATSTPMAISTPTPISGQDQVPTGSAGIYLGTDFSVGDIVEVSGTGGQGLSLRREPSLSAVVDGYGMESEIFEIKGGPIEVDGYYWWFLVSPYDNSKNGWGVEDFLQRSSP